MPPKFFFYLLLLAFVSCDSEKPKRKINPQARALNDTACMISRSGKAEDVLRAITLLDSATAIDPDYFTAYWNKMAFLNETKQYSRSLRAVKELNRLHPNDPVF